MHIDSKVLTKEEFCVITRTKPDSKLFELLGETAYFMRLPNSIENGFIWYHAGTHDDNNPYFGNFEVHQDLHEVWVDSNKIASAMNLEPRRYGFWHLWAKY